MASRAATTGARQRTAAKRGRPTSLDLPVPLHGTVLPQGEAIAKLVRTGLPVKEAAQALGLDYSAAYRCLGDGRVVAGLLWEGRLTEADLTDFQAAALAFYHHVDKAEAEAIALHTSALAKHATGGNVRRRTVTTYDSAGQVTGTQTTEEILPPEVRASTFFLERRRPDEWGRTERREHAIVGGEATVGTARPLDRLLDALDQIERRKAAGAGIAAALDAIDVTETDPEQEAAAG